MKIKLTCDVPVDPIHGMTAGRVLPVLKVASGFRENVRWWVLGDAGSEVGIMEREARVVEEEEDDGEDQES